MARDFTSCAVWRILPRVATAVVAFEAIGSFMPKFKPRDAQGSLGCVSVVGAFQRQRPRKELSPPQVCFFTNYDTSSFPFKKRGESSFRCF